MSVKKNNGLFEKIKKTVAASEADVTPGQNNEQVLDIDAVKEAIAAEMETKYKQASLKRIKEEEQKFKEQLECSKAEHHKELKAKYSKVAQSVLQKREKELASKYQVQKDTEQKLQQHISKLQSELNKRFELQHVNEHQLHNQVLELQQEIDRLQQEMQLSIGEAKINARQEQEKASKALYEDLMQANRTETIRQIEQKFQTQYLNIEADLKRQHSEHIKQQSQVLLQDYEAKLSTALIEQKHEIDKKHAEQINKQSELFELRIKQEVDSAVALASQHLQVEFAQERTQLQAVIDSLRPEIEANRKRLHAEVEEEIRIEFSYKFEQLKLEMQQTKDEQVEALLTAEKQKLAESLQEENLIVLKYKEIEIREACDAQLLQVTVELKQQHAQQQQEAICEALERHEQVLRFEQQQLLKQQEEANALKIIEQQNLIKQVEQQYLQQLQDQQQLSKQTEQQFMSQLFEQQQQFEITKQQLQHKYEQQLEQVNVDHAERIQLAVMQEKIRSSQQNTMEKKVLLNQQQNNLQNQFDQEKNTILTQQQIQLSAQFDLEKQQLLERIKQQQLDMQQLELKLNVEYQQGLQAKINQAVMTKELELQEQFAIQLREAKQPMLVAAAPSKDHDLEMRMALQQQETTLRIQFATQLEQARSEWQQQIGEQQSVSKEQLQQHEKVLRNEFQALLVAQRKQAAANYEKQLDIQIRNALKDYKQQLTAELNVTRINDLAASEQALREKFEARLKQQAEIAKSELERIKAHLQDEQQEQIDFAVTRKTETLAQQYEQQLAKYNHEQEEKMVDLIESERKKINIRFAQDKATLIKDLTAKFTREKQIEMHKYETELRDKLYKEMVKQKDYIQQKFASTQESALKEQKRRIEAQHKQEIERIKQGYFEPNFERTQHEHIIAERGVEQLADKILAKFQSK